MQKQIKNFLLLVLLLLTSEMAFSQAFTTTWRPTDAQIVIPTKSASGTYNYNVTISEKGTGNNSRTFTNRSGNLTISG